MSLPDPTLANLREGLSTCLSELLDSYDLQPSAPAEEPASPPVLVETFNQLFDAMRRTEYDARSGNQPAADAVTELGEYALGLFEETLGWATRLGLPEVHQDLQTHTISMARWIGRHGGEIQLLEPVVDALAQQANTMCAPDELLTLYQTMGEVIDATADFIREDLEKDNPGRPWRVLQMNRAIVATRTHQTDAMDTAFQALISHLPQDAPKFFSEGMEQMDLLNYPPHVREVMDRYYRKWSIDRTLH
ncbi:hypothetical protein DFR30_1061 [Thiogranum longum]|uniref:Uncharacterized protein n=1 Tax=Thiogranum longum TaxID=1537524 RepID=A0A4R1HKS9_9GAMM|nr:hypothetical protein [Thiogranum longum]TCK17812.1 hypothetical protein DFR30_1061 [Thiogranum longum]